MQEYLSEMIEGLVLRIPEAMTILLVILYYLKNIKKTTGGFSLSVNDLKKEVSDDFDEAKKRIESITENSINKLNALVKEQLEETKKTMEEHKKKIDDYYKVIDDLKKENEYNLIVSNSMIEILASSLSKDHELIKSGLSSELIPKLKSVSETIKENPNHKLDNVPVFEETLKSLYSVLGEKDLKRLLNKVKSNYEKETKL